MSGLALTRHPIESVLPLKYTETQQAIMRPPVGICVKEVYAVKRELTVNKFLLKESSGKLLKCFSPITLYG